MKKKNQLQKKDLKPALLEKINHYESLTRQALAKAKICVETDSALYSIAVDFKEMANAYFQDGLHFKKQGDLLTGLAALSYAHAWLDAGARLGFFNVEKDNKLFTLYK